MTDQPRPFHARAIDLGDGGNLTEQSAEIARIWVTHEGGSSVWIDASLLEDPRVFGYLMADVMRHAAQAYTDLTGKPVEEMLAEIIAGTSEMIAGSSRDESAEGMLN